MLLVWLAGLVALGLYDWRESGALPRISRGDVLAGVGARPSSSRRSTSLASTTGRCRSARTSRRSWASRMTTRTTDGVDPFGVSIYQTRPTLLFVVWGHLGKLIGGIDLYAHAPPSRAGRTAHDRGLLLPLPAASAARVGAVREQRLRAQPRLPDDQPARDEGEHRGRRRGGRPRAPAVRLPPRHLFSRTSAESLRDSASSPTTPGARRSCCGLSSSACSRCSTDVMFPLRRIATFGAAALAGFVIMAGPLVHRGVESAAGPAAGRPGCTAPHHDKGTGAPEGLGLARHHPATGT